MGRTDRWSISSDGDTGGLLEIFLKGKKKDIPLSSMHVGVLTCLAVPCFAFFFFYKKYY